MAPGGGAAPCPFHRAALIAAFSAALAGTLSAPARGQEEAKPGEGDTTGTAAGEAAPGSAAGEPAGPVTLPVPPGPAEPAEPFESVEPAEPPVPPVPPVPTTPLGPSDPDSPRRYKAMIRPGLWLAGSDCHFRKSTPLGAPGNSFSLENGFRADGFHALLPFEALIRTKKNEFRLRYVWWNTEGARDMPVGFKFGDIDLVASQRVTAALDTDVVGLDLLFHVAEYRYFELFVSTGADIFMTKLELEASPVMRDEISAAVPVFTVGLGVRFNIREGLSVFLSNSALSYAQLFGIHDQFFDVKDTYRNIEVCARWEFARYPDLTLGAGWRHYEVGFADDELMATQQISGVVGWVRYQF